MITSTHDHTYHHATLFLEMHSFETEDSVIDFGLTSYEGEFFQVSKKFEHTDFDEESQFKLYELNIFLSQNGMHHKRRVYNIIDLMGDIGGLLEISMILFGIFLYPISEHSFVIKVAKRMFFARTKDYTLFQTP